MPQNRTSHKRSRCPQPVHCKAKRLGGGRDATLRLPGVFTSSLTRPQPDGAVVGARGERKAPRPPPDAFEAAGVASQALLNLRGGLLHPRRGGGRANGRDLRHGGRPKKHVVHSGASRRPKRVPRAAVQRQGEEDAILDTPHPAQKTRCRTRAALRCARYPPQLHDVVRGAHGEFEFEIEIEIEIEVGPRHGLGCFALRTRAGG